MKAIIPTGGRGTRMRPITFSSNKHFIPVANKPLIFFPIETVAGAGIKEIGITYNPEYFEQVKEVLGDGSRWGVKISYILQPEPKGLANIIEVSEKYLAGDKFLLHLGDNIFADGIKEAVEYFEEKSPNALVTMVEHEENYRMGVPYFDKSGRLIKYIEKPANPPNNFAIPGLYFFDKTVFACFKGQDKIKPSERGELEISAPFQWLIDHGFRVEVTPYTGKWLDPGKFDDWLEANQYILDKGRDYKIDSDLDQASVVENRVGIGKNCLIQNSQIRGPVMIGNNVKVIDSYIGPFTSIADNTEVISSHIENSVLMEGVKVIRARERIDTSLIGTGTEIVESKGPMSSMQLFVGEKCRVEL